MLHIYNNTALLHSILYYFITFITQYSTDEEDETSWGQRQLFSWEEQQAN